MIILESKIGAGLHIKEEDRESIVKKNIIADFGKQLFNNKNFKLTSYLNDENNCETFHGMIICFDYDEIVKINKILKSNGMDLGIDFVKRDLK